MLDNCPTAQQKVFYHLYLRKIMKSEIFLT